MKNILYKEIKEAVNEVIDKYYDTNSDIEKQTITLAKSKWSQGLVILVMSRHLVIETFEGFVIRSEDTDLYQPGHYHKGFDESSFIFKTIEI